MDLFLYVGAKRKNNQHICQWSHANGKFNLCRECDRQTGSIKDDYAILDIARAICDICYPHTSKLELIIYALAFAINLIGIKHPNRSNKINDRENYVYFISGYLTYFKYNIYNQIDIYDCNELSIAKFFIVQVFTFMVNICNKLIGQVLFIDDYKSSNVTGQETLKNLLKICSHIPCRCLFSIVSEHDLLLIVQYTYCSICECNDSIH